MKSILEPVKHICPETGKEIEPKPLPRRMIVRRYMSTAKSWPQMLNRYFEIGFKGLSDKQIDTVYNTIKGFSCSKQIHLNS